MTSLDVAETANGPYRAAIIGCGRMAHGHARAWNDDPRARLVACADLSPEAATNFANEFGIPATYTDYPEMLLTERPDVRRRLERVVLLGHLCRGLGEVALDQIQRASNAAGRRAASGRRGLIGRWDSEKRKREQQCHS